MDQVNVNELLLFAAARTRVPSLPIQRLCSSPGIAHPFQDENSFLFRRRLESGGCRDPVLYSLRPSLGGFNYPDTDSPPSVAFDSYVSRHPFLGVFVYLVLPTHLHGLTRLRGPFQIYCVLSPSQHFITPCSAPRRLICLECSFAMGPPMCRSRSSAWMPA